MINRLVTTFVFAFALLQLAAAASAQTQIRQLGYDAPDGARITGFMMQKSRDIPDTAPIAVLMHGLTGSSVNWLAPGTHFSGDDVVALLLDRGYRIYALDARAHGGRRDGLSPIERVKQARAGDPASYQAMIEDTISDYRFLMDRIAERHPDARQVVAVGYSMGAQMATLLSAQDPRISHLVTMVPPAVQNVPAVAPITHAAKVEAHWLLLTANKDRFATPDQNRALADAAAGVKHLTFASGHMLPAIYVSEIGVWLQEQSAK